MTIPDFGRAAAEAGGTLITARLGPLPQGRNGGCGAPTRVAGTNGGWMPCGALLTNLGKTEPYYCGACHEAHQRAKQMSGTPIIDHMQQEMVMSNMPVHQQFARLLDKARQLERDRAILLLAVRAALEDDRIDVSSMTDEALVAKITEALGDSQ